MHAVSDQKLYESVSFCQKTSINIQLWHWLPASQPSNPRNPSTHHKMWYIGVQQSKHSSPDAVQCQNADNSYMYNLIS